MIKITKKSNKAWVTFSLNPNYKISSIEVLGEWNDWKPETMKQKKSGEYAITKIIKTADSYQFGYRIDGKIWEVEPECSLVSSPFNSRNSLLKL